MLMMVVFGVFNFNFLIEKDLVDRLIIAAVATVAAIDRTDNNYSILYHLERLHSL